MEGLAWAARELRTGRAVGRTVASGWLCWNIGQGLESLTLSRVVCLFLAPIEVCGILIP